MLEMLKGLFSQGYEFVEVSYYGQSKVDDFSEVEEAITETEDDEWLDFEYEIDDKAQVVYYQVQNNE